MMKISITLFIFVFLFSCATKNMLVITKIPPAKPEVILNKQVTFKKNGTILIIPLLRKELVLEEEIDGEKKQLLVITASELHSKLVKLFLSKGYNVLNESLIARIESKLTDKKKDDSAGDLYNLKEKALIFGKDSAADYILFVDLFSFKPVYFVNYIMSKEGGDNYYEYKPYNEFDVEQNRNTDANCFNKIKLNQVEIEAELIDIKTGSLLWKAYSEIDTRAILPTNWMGKYSTGKSVLSFSKNKSCKYLESNYYLEKYILDPVEITRQIDQSLKNNFSDL